MSDSYKKSPAGRAVKAIKRKTPRARYSKAKYTSRRRNVVWKLTFEEYNEIIKNPCYYCNNKLGKAVTRGAGLDRVDNNIREYTVENCVSCCNKCNTIKSTYPIEIAKEKINALIAKIDVNETLDV